MLIIVKKEKEKEQKNKLISLIKLQFTHGIK